MVMIKKLNRDLLKRMQEHSLRKCVKDWCLLLKTSRVYVVCVCVLLRSCLTLCDPADCSPPGSSVHGISQAGILEWVGVSFSRGSSQSRD